MKEKIILWETIPPMVEWNRLRALRRSRKMTRAALSIRSGVSFSYLTNIEAGLDNGVSAEIREKIAGALAVPAAAVFPTRCRGMVVIETGEKLKAAKPKKKDR